MSVEFRRLNEVTFLEVVVDFPKIDEAYLKNIFSLLVEMDVDLDSDPLVYGPKRLNAKVALCREHLSKCQRIYLQLSNDKHQLGRAQRQAKLDMDLLTQELLANDPEVRSQKNIRDREAVASSKLREERESVFRIETSITDLDSVIAVVKAKQNDLKDIQSRIRDQVKLCQEEIGIGLRWGSASPTPTSIDLSERPRIDVAKLEAFHWELGGLGGDTSITDLESFVRSETGQAVDFSAHSEVVSAPSDVVQASPGVEPTILGDVETPPKEVEAHSVNLSVEPAIGQGQPATSSDEEVADFFDRLHVADDAAATAPPPPVGDFNIDDILGDLGV